MSGGGSMRTLVRAAGVSAVQGMLPLLERSNRRSRGLLTVLTYHRIDELHARPDLDPALISASPREFERQVAWLAANTRPLSIADVLEVRRTGTPLPPRSVLITFDDAYRDFAEDAWPCLRAHAVPATLFVPTAYPGSPAPGFWWDRLHRALSHQRAPTAIATSVGVLPLATDEDRTRAHRTLCDWVKRSPHDEAMAEVQRIVLSIGAPDPVAPILSWDELRQLARDGVTVAPHSRTHARLDGVPLARAREEIAGSRDDLVREIGRCPPAFAFPDGGHHAGLRALLADEGFELAFTTRPGANDPARADWLGLRRANVGRASSLPVIRARLLWSTPRAAAASPTARP